MSIFANEDLKIFESISRKMNVIIFLLMETQKDIGYSSDVDKISKLKKCGLENEDIGQILGKTSKQISKQIYKSKIRSNKK